MQYLFKALYEEGPSQVLINAKETKEFWSKLWDNPGPYAWMIKSLKLIGEAPNVRHSSNQL